MGALLVLDEFSKDRAIFGSLAELGGPVKLLRLSAALSGIGMLSSLREGPRAQPKQKTSTL